LSHNLNETETKLKRNSLKAVFEQFWKCFVSAETKRFGRHSPRRPGRFFKQFQNLFETVFWFSFVSVSFQLCKHHKSTIDDVYEQKLGTFDVGASYVSHNGLNSERIW